MQNAALLHPAAPPGIQALRGTGLTDGHAVLIVGPVSRRSELDGLVSSVASIRGVGYAYVERRDGDAAQVRVITARPVALASELRVALRGRVVACTWVGDRFEVRLAGHAPRTRDVGTPRFDHRVASDLDRALGFDVYDPAPTRRYGRPVPTRPPARAALARHAGLVPGRLALGAGR